MLNNEVMPKRNCVVFDDSTPGTRVTVPMKRCQRSSYVKIRVPKANELKAFFAVNPHLLHWTADALIDGSIRAKKVALRGQAHDAWPHIGDKMLDRIIKSGSIAGMRDEVPLSGFDAEAEDEIDDCEGCKARMHAPVRRNTPKPVQIKPGDVAVDIQMFKCKQVGSGATYGTVFVLLWWCLPWYESHGSEKGGFEMAVDKARIKMLRLQKVDLREGRIFDGQQASKSVHLESEDGGAFNHMYSDYDSVIKNYKTSAALRQANIDQTYSAPNAHNRNPAENYMRIVKEGALAMQALAALPDSLAGRCWEHAALMQGLTLPRRRHSVRHKDITPWQAFTGQQPRWKDIRGLVMGMMRWGYRERDTRPQLGLDARHDGWGFWVGREIVSRSHLVYDPYSKQLIKYASVSGSPNVLLVQGRDGGTEPFICGWRSCERQDTARRTTIGISWLLSSDHSCCGRSSLLHIEMRCDMEGKDRKQLRKHCWWVMLDESAMLVLEELQTALKKTEGEKDGGAPEEKASVDGAGGAPERRISGRASRPPVDATSWRSDTWADVVQKMNRARVYRDVKRQRTEVKDGELEIIMRTLTGRGVSRGCTTPERARHFE